VSTRQQRLAELARQAPQLGFTSLNHHLAFTWLLVAYWGTRRDGASGVDAVTAADYAADLVPNLRSLPGRAQAGSYRAPPVRRVHISKGPGSKETRPSGIPTLQDKVLQRAIVLRPQPI
jgi:retron-type reverse transcriptase